MVQNPVHILHVLNSASGGSAISTLELIRALSLKGVISSLVCFNNATPEQAQMLTAAVEGRILFIPLYWMNKRIRAATWKRPLIELKALWETHKGFKHQQKMSSFIAQYGVTIIHTSTIVNPEGAIAARKNKLPHVWHVRELIGEDKHFRFYNFKQWAVWISANCDALIPNSTVTAQCLHPYFDPSKIEIIPNGINVEVFEVKTHVDKTNVVIGMLGSPISRWKNHSFLIQVAAALKDHDLEFRIYGALPGEGDQYYLGLKNLIHQLGVHDSVKFMAAQKPDYIMREIDILFHPAHLESFGRIFIEAMAGGIPVVAVNEGGALEMIRDNVNGLLVPVGDIDAAADAITRLSQNHELRNFLGRKGRKLAEEQYSMDILSDRMIGVYKKVVEIFRI